MLSTLLLKDDLGIWAGAAGLALAKLGVVLAGPAEALADGAASDLAPKRFPNGAAGVVGVCVLVEEDAKRFGAGVDWGFADSGSDGFGVEVDAPIKDPNGLALAGFSGVCSAAGFGANKLLAAALSVAGLEEKRFGAEAVCS